MANPPSSRQPKGAQFIEGRLERVEEVYKRGLRHLQLLHDQDDMVKSMGGTDDSRSGPTAASQRSARRW